jgi:hypothetical protein
MLLLKMAYRAGKSSKLHLAHGKYSNAISFKNGNFKNIVTEF